ncbi:uncharacterized protein [Drosophila bipectinata]|uniref:uncharacterized protein n=1 Tax=Drosophila bipectinata TaxID=42026 RepID=UPI001C8A03AD|nr:uncharacterized protein LOC108119541 [Drosophila bipectinata]
MEKVYIIALVISLFVHLKDLFNPIEPTMESTVFIFLTMMAFKKIMRRNSGYNANVLEKMAQILILCMGVQVLLVAAWFPLSESVHHLVEMACHRWPWGRGWMFKQVKDVGASWILVALELVAFFLGFKMKGVQQFFGARDDLISRSVMTIIGEQYQRVWNREKRYLRNCYRTLLEQGQG